MRFCSEIKFPSNNPALLNNTRVSSHAEFSPPVVHLTFDRLENGERVRDISGNANDGIINQGFQIAPGAGKCDSAGNLNGWYRVDGRNYRVRFKMVGPFS